MMMGSIGDLLKEPTDKQVFIEDLSDDQLSKGFYLFYYSGILLFIKVEIPCWAIQHGQYLLSECYGTMFENDF